MHFWVLTSTADVARKLSSTEDQGLADRISTFDLEF